MSGGSLDYEFNRIENLADTIERYAKKPLHRAFAAHLRKVARAAHDLEWVWSGDNSDGDEDDAIRACLSPGAPLEQTIEDAKRAVAELQNELTLAKESTDV